jgi:flagellar hook-associated protein 1 FlgK
MSLFSSLQLANNALRAQQIGLQVTGQNIANANTPGYVREEVVLTPADSQRLGNLRLGLGVEVSGVVQKIDRFLENRLRNAVSDRASGEVQQETYSQLEGIIGELGDTDLSTSLNNFFGSISDILNQPESVTTRNLAVLQGQTLTTNINRLSNRVRELRTDVNQRVTNAASDINRLVEDIRKLNVQITESEASDTSLSDAVGLRDQRGIALKQLSEIIDISVVEESTGAVNVFAGGDFLVFEGLSRQVEVEFADDRGLAVSRLQIADSDSDLQVTSGQLAGLIRTRDESLGGFLDQLDDFSQTLAFEFNKAYSQGQGLNGYKQLTSEFAVDDSNAALDAAGLPFTPVNGSLQVQVFNRKTGLTQTTDIFVDLDGLNDDDTSLNDLAAALDAVSGITATVTATRQLEIKSDAVDQEFAFANDTSSVLAALGLNTFFKGSSAQTLGLSQPLVDDPAKFATSREGIGQGTTNAVALADFLDTPLESKNGDSIGVLYDKLHGSVTQQSSVARAVADGFRVFEETLNGQHLAISGVSIDEEAVKLITYQRAFQASAKFIATMSELLELLVNL